jgi:hypothetical protein
MAQYGYIIDSDLQSDKRDVYEMFSKYFGNPTLTKIRDEQRYSTYAVKLNVHLRENRYLMLITTNDANQIGTMFPLDDIKWEALQTRSTDSEFNCGSFTYMPRRKPPYTSRIFLKERQDKRTTYTSKDYPLSLCLLHTGKSKYEYPNLGTISSALESWQTIIKIEI